MRPTVSQYAQALDELSRAPHSDVEKLTRNLLGFLKRRGETAKAGAILNRLEGRRHEQDRRLAVTAVTAHTASSETKRVLERLAAAIFPKQTLELQYETDMRVIGGVRFQTEETLYDATIGADLKELKKTLSK